MSITSNFPKLKPSLLLDFANTRALDPRMAYTCASPQEYFGGEMVLAEQNLLTRTERVVENWSSMTSSRSEYLATISDRGFKSFSVVPDTSNVPTHYLYSPWGVMTFVAGKEYTHTIKVKANGYNFAGLVISGNQTRVVVNLTTGVVSFTTGATPTTQVTPLSDGVHKVKITWTAPTTSVGELRIYAMPSSGDPVTLSFAGDGVSGVIVSEMQIREGNLDVAYIPTDLTPITRYQPKLSVAPANTPFFPVDPATGESLGLGCIPAVTNLTIKSDDFADSAWSKTDCSISTDGTIAPDGTLCKKVVENLTTNRHFIIRNGSSTITSGNKYTIVAIVKPAGRNFVALQVDGATGSAGGVTLFNLTNSSVQSLPAGVNAGIQNLGGGWCLCYATATATGGAARPTLFLAIDGATTSAATNYLGDGISGLFVWRVGLMAGEFSGIPPKTEGSQVTRAATTPVVPLSSIPNFSPTEGTFFVDVDFGEAPPVEKSIGVLGQNVSGTGTSFVHKNSGGVSWFAYFAGALRTYPSSGATLSRQKFAFAWKANSTGGVDLSLARNGQVSTIANLSNDMQQVSSLLFGGRYGAISSELRGLVDFKAYAKALSNAELEALTK